MPGGNTRATLWVRPHPPYFDHAAGYRVWDVDGHCTIDVQANYGSLIHGHAPAPVVAAAEQAIRCGSAVGLPSRHEVTLAEMLTERRGVPTEWRFCNSGTEAVMLAVRIARATTGRQLLIRFEASYHGSYDDVADPAIGVSERSGTDRVLVLPRDDIAALEQAFAMHGTRVGAVLVDPMPNRAGLMPVSQEFLERARQLCSAAGTFLIADEVITFRLSEGGLFANAGVEPDLLVLGKIIGGGFPVGAVGGAPSSMRTLLPGGPLAIGGTFSANPVTMAAGIATLHSLGTAEIMRINLLGDHLREELCHAGFSVTGAGSLLRILLPMGTQEAFWWAAYDAGVLLCTNGLACISTVMDESVTQEIAHRLVVAGRNLGLPDLGTTAESGHSGVRVG